MKTTRAEILQNTDQEFLGHRARAQTRFRAQAQAQALTSGRSRKVKNSKAANFFSRTFFSQSENSEPEAYEKTRRKNYYLYAQKCSICWCFFTLVNFHLVIVTYILVLWGDGPPGGNY